MRSPFAKREAGRLDLGDGLWVDVQAELTYGERRQLRNEFMRLAGKPENYEAAAVKLLEIAILNWNFVDKAEKPVLVTREAIDGLQDDVARDILERLDKLYAPLDDSKKKT